VRGNSERTALERSRAANTRKWLAELREIVGREDAAQSGDGGSGGGPKWVWSLWTVVVVMMYGTIWHTWAEKIIFLRCVAVGGAQAASYLWCLCRILHLLVYEGRLQS
jgi:hypothetical protein